MLTKLRRRMKDMRALTELMTTAERHARADGVALPGSEHIVAAAIGHSDGRAASLAGSHGVDAEQFLAEVRRLHAEALDDIGIDARDDAIGSSLPATAEPDGLYRAAPSAQQLLSRVADTSTGFDSAAIIREAARSRHGTTAAALRRLGITANGPAE